MTTAPVSPANAPAPSPRYRICEHCGSQMTLSRDGAWYYCANIAHCAFVSPVAADDVSPAYLSLLRARRRALRGPRTSY